MMQIIANIDHAEYQTVALELADYGDVIINYHIISE